MTGETEQDVSAQTTDTLKVLMDRSFDQLDQRLVLIQQHFEARIDNFEKRLTERAAAQDTAISKAEAQQEKRLDSVNEFRAQLTDQTKTFIPRETADAMFGAIMSRLSALENFQATQTGKTTGVSDVRVWVLAAVTVAGFMLLLYTR